MKPRWPKTTHLKIHEHCGGQVRWVEAIDQPGVGFTGECLHCHEERIPVEEILPFELPDGMTVADAYNATDIDDLRVFEWDRDPDLYEKKQAEFRELVDA